MVRDENLNEHQLYLAGQILDVFQAIMDELEPLCLRLGDGLSRPEIIELVQAKFNVKIEVLKRWEPLKETL